MTGCALRGLARALLARGGAEARVVDLATRPWASLTFDGATHRLGMLLPAGESAGFAEGIEEAPFALAGHILADIAIVASERRGGLARLTIEALTVVDA